MENGLSTASAHAKLREVGKNEITSTSTFSLTRVFIEQFISTINALLLVAGIFFFFVGDQLDGFFILAVILVNGIFGFLQEYKAEKSVEKLKHYQEHEARVIRDGKMVTIPTGGIVPGDVVYIAEGERVPADGTMIEDGFIEIDEAILTGESLPVMKEKNGKVFSGSLVVKGNGRFLVTQTGNATRFGQIAQTLSSIENDKTPLQKQLGSLGKTISFVALGTAMLLIPVEFLQGKDLIPTVLVAFSIGIAVIPEGLPAVVTIALAIGTSRMAKRKAIIRKMPAIETLGAVQIILTDKTGTLTQNNMRVREFWHPSSEHLPHLLTAAFLGNTATLIQKGSQDSFDVVGDQTDGALLLFTKDKEPGIETRLKSGKVIDEFTFDSIYKTISTTWEEHDKRFVFVRGAPEMILEKSTASKKDAALIREKIDDYARRGLRVIAFGSKHEKRKGKLTREEYESELTFLGIVGIYDPPRHETKAAIEKATKAGIRTIMVTGDNELTALTIAKEIHLIAKDEDVITGAELDTLSESDLKAVLAKTRVFARVKPQDKHRLTLLLQQEGYIVGVTGDGVNDSLALKQADVGVAMGKSGTDVAKEASDIILADDNFATLIKAIEEGRTIYANIVKAILYLLSGNLILLSLVFIAAIIGLPSPLTPTQILWINLIADGVPALALATDNRNPHILDDRPRDPKMPILTGHRLLFIVLLGLNVACFLILCYMLLLPTFSEPVTRTLLFNLLVICRLGLAFVIRGQSLFRVNKLLIGAVIVTLLLQLIITTTPVFQTIFHLALP